MFEVKEELLKDILNYLATKPYAEVFNIVKDIQLCKKIEVDAEEKTDAKL